MPLSPEDFLEVKLIQIKEDLVHACQDAKESGVSICVYSGKSHVDPLSSHEDPRIRSIVSVQDELSRVLDEAIANIRNMRAAKVSAARSYKMQLGYENGLFETNLKKKIANSLGYERFSEIPKKVSHSEPTEK